MGPGALSEILEGLPNREDRDLLVGFDTADDACVYRVSPDVAVIQTVDFFTPIADDPYIFGQIAAANALSDVYAMGGEPKLCMNLLCVPNCLPPSAVREILRGGHDKAVEAGCVIAGGHTIEDKEPKYGMCVTGFVHPDRILRNAGAQTGDVLILTKPVGSGVIVTAKKGELASEEDYAAALEHMRRLNRTAGMAAAANGCVHACTDITGFGLMGHAYEMAAGSGVTVVLDSRSVPLMNGAKELAEMGILPGGVYRNRNYVKPHAKMDTAEEALVDLMCDPQTSGGLLIALPPTAAEQLLKTLRETDPWACMIGTVEEAGAYAVIVK